MIPAVLALLQQVPRGALRASGDSLVPAGDTLAAAVGPVRDTLRAPPLPQGVAAAVRLLFDAPRWVQLSAIGVGGVAGIALLALLWRRRQRITGWVRTRRRGVRWTIAGCAVLVLALAAFAGGKSWHYMQHDNGFCTGCHIMERPFGRFGIFAGKHDSRSCHDCHQQSLYASTRQMVLWIANRPAEIGKHAPVPNSRCEGCHQLATGRKPWQHAHWLAGHKAHFESDSAPLRDLLCVKCHGAEIHRFLPSSRTCQQEGCHVNQHVKLGRMARLPEISCVTCHAFTADLPALADRDSAVHALIPSQKQCLGCHGMQGKPPGYIAAKDPHKGLCGSCHDVHKDTLPADARASCQRCHANVANQAFHAGVNHRRIASQCLVCHQPHAASVDASDCVGCHTAVQKRGQFHPPLPFDTNSVVRRRVSAPPGGTSTDAEDQAVDHRGKGDALPERRQQIRDAPAAVPTSPADSFPHARHTSLPCLTCHLVARNTSKYGLVFEVPRGCDLCHHRSIMAGAVEAKDCARCHRPDALATPRPMPVAIAAGTGAPVVRSVAFRHERHQRLACSTCHQPPSPSPPDSIRTCTACHAQHHSAERNCASCHFRAETPAAHSRTTHAGCDACHAKSRIAELVPTRTFCITCHAPQLAHQPGRECTTCHFLMTPEAYRPRLVLGTGA